MQCSVCDAAFERHEELKQHEQNSHHGVTVHSTSDSKTVYECDHGGCLRHYTSYSRCQFCDFSASSQNGFLTSVYSRIMDKTSEGNREKYLTLISKII
jgi:hypothetical protein